jgi:hypothetical protein
MRVNRRDAPRKRHAFMRENSAPTRVWPFGNIGLGRHWLLIFAFIAAASACYAQSGEPDLQIQEKALANTAEEVNLFEKYVFREGENAITELSNKRDFYYSLLGYIGREEGFQDLMFVPGPLMYPARPGNLFLTWEPTQADILAVLTDGTLSVPTVTPIMGVNAKMTQGNITLFDGACVLSRVYAENHLQRTIIGINLLRVGPWDPTGANPNRSIVPAACLAVAIASHLGLHAVVGLPAEQVIRVVSGRFFVEPQIVAAITDLYRSGVIEGMTRAEAKQRVAGYYLPRLIQFLEMEKRQNGGR